MKMQRSIATLFCAVVGAGSLNTVPVQADEKMAASAASGYQMAAVIDRARGGVVLAGDYGKAIEELGAKRPKKFEASTNLCVAYTMTGDLDRADAECAEALAQSEKTDVRRDIALAWSNLGVVKAVSGDLKGARRSFRRALEISADLRQASDNLRLLQSTEASEV